MRSIYDSVVIRTTIVPSVLTGASTSTATVVNGTTCDTKGYNTALIHAVTGNLPTGVTTLTVTVQECATVGGTFTNALDNTGTVIGFTYTANTTATESGVTLGTARIEGLGLNRLRYLRGVISYVQSATTVVATTYATFLLGRAFEEPVRTAVSNT